MNKWIAWFALIMLLFFLEEVLKYSDTKIIITILVTMPLILGVRDD